MLMTEEQIKRQADHLIEGIKALQFATNMPEAEFLSCIADVDKWADEQRNLIGKG